MEHNEFVFTSGKNEPLPAVVYASGDHTYFSQLFSLAENEGLEIEAYAKSTGEDLSRFYLGIAPYDSDKEFIPRIQMLFQGETLTVKSVNISDCSITLDGVPHNWYPDKLEKVHYDQRNIGFYLDGCVTQGVDFIIESAYESLNGTTTISITDTPENREKLKCIVPFETKVRNHIHSGTYVYCSAYDEKIPNVWKPCKGSVVGPGFNTYSAYPYGTKYFKVLILANYRQGANAELLIKDIRVSKTSPEKEK
eukprot:TRINITY_DN2980_c0_g1_i1.p1 TRINITY_DN2980_c0_g1~~TRINITY_DN2980_c0_g1_i1.p1  ORF type:complete len:251 (-),score=20.12 TRINITY_DN2980_c0_g1_i1:27-779(-)